ncbi:MAG TPA: integrase arm-type DNA-binding domain-containing protein [Thermoanaerobaculia bacterium]|nr:integrase arm-type DNA-binding domain-containing protein [Thermoanaerobaculia bacterium]
MPLTDTSIRKAKATNKPRKLFDERGLFLSIAPTGGKLWRYKYRFGGKEKLLALGTYPDVSLASARERRDAARRLVAAGVDPSAQRRAERAAADSSFETIAREWFAKFSPQWVESHNQTVLSRMERDLFPYMGKSAISAITAPELLSVLQRIERRGANETARRVRQICSQVFRYAIATARAERDPSADLRGALAPVVTVHRAAISSSINSATP